MRSILRLLLTKNPLRQMAKTDRKVLAICIGAAFVFWIILNLSRDYTVARRVAVAYQVDPERTVKGQERFRTLDVTLTGSGWNLLLESLRRRPPVARVDVGDLESYRLSEMEFVSSITRQLTNGGIEVRLPGFRPETIYTTAKEGKRVPVVSRLRIEYAEGYRPITRPRLTPDSITVAGASEDLEAIVEWPTEATTVYGVDADLQQVISLATPPTDTLTISQNRVTIRVGVEAFIEERFTLPIRLVNGQPGATYEFSPQIAEVVANLPQSAYGTFTADDFELVLDLTNFAGLASDNIVPLQLRRQPAVARAVRFEPRVASCYLVE